MRVKHVGPAAARFGANRQSRGTAAGRGPRSLLLTLAIVLAAANLRPALASVGPVLDDVRADLDLATTGAALLTTLPVLCLGVLAPLAPRLARRLGFERTLAAVLVVLLTGLLLRVADGPAVLFAGTAAAAGAIAVGNVLVPALIKRDFPGRTGTMMGIYTMSLSGAAALAAGMTVPVGELLGAGWRGALAAWAVLPALALVAWLPFARQATAPGSVSSPDAGARLLRDPLAWQVTVFFGLQSLSFYSVLAWLPSVYRDQGFPAASAGLLLSVATVVQAPVGLLTPRLATHGRDQRWVVAVAGLLVAVGFLGILLAPTAAPYLWVAVLGVGHGASFALALLLTVLRARTSAETARLSAMAQTIGYTIAAAGPLLVGALRAASGSWTLPLVLLLGLLVPQLAAGLGAGRLLYVGVETADEPGAG